MSRTTCSSVRRPPCTPEAATTLAGRTPPQSWRAPPPLVCPVPCRALAGTSAGVARAGAWPQAGIHENCQRSVSATRQACGPDRRGLPSTSDPCSRPMSRGIFTPPRRRAAEESLREPAGLSSSPRQGRLGGKLADARSGAPLPDPATTPARRGVRRRSVWRGHSVSPCFWCPVRDAFRPSPVAVEDREPHDLRCAHRQCHHNDTGTPSGPMPKPLARHMGSAIRPGWGVRVPYAWIPVAVDHLRPLAHQVIP
jgi:hypothetical protein